MNFSTDDMARASGGRIIGPPTVVNGMEYDSRVDTTGKLFAAVSDSGFAYVADALQNGAVSYLANQVASGIGSGVVVEDVNAALRSLASLGRSRMSANVIGVTGSVGKTTVKDLITSIVASAGIVSSSRGNFNNDFGVAHTLINANENCATLVVEMGMRATGEINRLAELARPNVGVITHIGESHIGELGDQTTIAAAKGELVASLPVTGTAVLNADQEWVTMLRSSTEANVVTFGKSLGDVRAANILLDNTGRASFVLETPDERGEVRLMLRGAHNAVNAAAAAAACLAIGVSFEAIIAGLEGVTSAPGRMTFKKSVGGATVIDDTYNASPTSIKAALETLGSTDANGRRIAMWSSPIKPDTQQSGMIAWRGSPDGNQQEESPGVHRRIQGRRSQTVAGVRRCQRCRSRTPWNSWHHARQLDQAGRDR